MTSLRFLILLVPAIAAADDFTSWKVPDGGTMSPDKCAKGDAKECLHLAWDSEAGGQGIDDTSHDRLVHARDWFQQACTIAKKPSCPNADRMAAKIAKVDAIKKDSDKKLFYCADALDSAKLRVAGSKTAPTVVVRDCIIDMMPEGFKDALSGLGKKTKAQRQEQVLQAGLDKLCTDMGKEKPSACSVKVKGLSVAKQREASGEILGAAYGGELLHRGAEINDFLIF
ncbi:MAG: hypothetical protein QM831_43705 [Kofleriaceae bacterium]